MVRIDVVNDRCGFCAPFGQTADAQRMMQQESLSRLCPAVVISTLRCTPTPSICLCLLLLTAWRSGWSKLLCALHTSRHTKARLITGLCRLILSGMAFALALNRLAPFGLRQGGG